MHVVDDPAQRKAMLDGMLAWNSDFHYLYIDIAGTACCRSRPSGRARSSSRPSSAAAASSRADVHELACARARERAAPRRRARGRGRDARVDGQARRGDPRRPRPAQLRLRADLAGSSRRSSTSGESVTAGQPVGRIYSLEHPEREPETVRAPLDGVVVGIRAISWTEQGDSTFVFGAADRGGRPALSRSFPCGGRA